MLYCLESGKNGRGRLTIPAPYRKISVNHSDTLLCHRSTVRCPYILLGKDTHYHGNDQSSHLIRLYGAASRAADPDGAPYGGAALVLRRLWLHPLDTPIIEASDVLLAKGGGETEKQIYRFSKGDSDLSLRFDLTVPLAKYVALHYADLAFPFRRFQIGKVYRGERAQRGRFREFYQADIDVIGDGELDITNDAEIPAIIYTVFSCLGLSRFQIRINNRRILNGFYAMLGLSDKSGDIMRTVDKIEKIGPDLVRAILVDDYAIEGEKGG